MANKAQWLHPNRLLLSSYVLFCSALLLVDSFVMHNYTKSVTINLFPGVPTETPPNAAWSLAKQEVNFSANRSDLEEIGSFINKFREMLFRPGKMTEITTALYSDEHLFEFFEEATDTEWRSQPRATEAFRKIREEIKKVYALELKSEVEIKGSMTPIGRRQKWNWVYDLFLLRALCQLFKAVLDAFRNKLVIKPAELTVVAVGICAQTDSYSLRKEVLSIGFLQSICPKTVDELVGKNEEILTKIVGWFNFRKDNIGEFFTKWEEYNTKMADLFSVELTLASTTNVHGPHRRRHNPVEADKRHHFGKAYPFNGHHKHHHWESVEYRMPRQRVNNMFHHPGLPFFPPPPPPPVPSPRWLQEHAAGMHRSQHRVQHRVQHRSQHRRRGQGRGRPRTRAYVHHRAYSWGY